MYPDDINPESGCRLPLPRREELSREAILVARESGDRAALAAALIGRHYALHEPENLDDRLSAAAELVRLAAAGGDREVLLQGYYLQHIDLLEAGNREGVDAALAAHGREAAAVRQPLFLWRTDLLLGMREMLEGRYVEAKIIIERAYAVAQRSAIRNGLPAYATQMIGLLSEAGGLEAVVPTTRSLLEQYPVRIYRAGLLLELIRLDLRHEVETEFAVLAGGEFDDLPLDDDWVTTVACLAEGAAYLDDVGRAARLYTLLLPFSGRNVVANAAVVSIGAVDRYLGLLATIMERWDEAERHFDAALTMHARFGARPWTARTRHDLACMLLRRGAGGDRQRAVTLIGEARSTAESLGMVYLARSLKRLEAAHELGCRADSADMPNGSARPLPAGLSSREAEVLRLVAEGRTNREIASDLVLSVRTVDHHIAAIYGKIGARRRADATTFALRNGLVTHA